MVARLARQSSRLRSLLSWLSFSPDPKTKTVTTNSNNIVHLSFFIFFSSTIVSAWFQTFLRRNPTNPTSNIANDGSGIGA